MKSNVKVCDVQETALLLRLKLGRIKSWTHFLGDSKRGKQNVAGADLFPVARMKGPRGYTPVYAYDDIMNFIDHILATHPELGKREPIAVKTVTIDSTLSWRMNKVDEDGDPVPGSRLAPATAGTNRGVSAFMTT